MITIVSGVPRSGTSMMMQCLVAGGMPALEDGHLPPDKFNPRGYFEYFAAKMMDSTGDASWIDNAEGRAVKVFARGLPYLPLDREYRIILMRRPFAASGESVRALTGNVEISVDWYANFFEERLNKALAYLREVKALKYLEVEYEDVLAAPQVQMDRIAEFVGLPLDRAAMATAVVPNRELR